MVNTASSKIGSYEVNYLNREEFLLLKKDIWNKQVYRFPLDIIQSTEDLIIVDLGAHIGLATMYFKNKYTNSHIYSLEPNPQLFNVLEENIGINNIKDVTPLNYAIAPKDSERDFFIDSKENWYSTGGFNPKAWNNRQNTNRISVQTISLDTLYKKFSIGKVDLLKIDIEGEEYSLIDNPFRGFDIVQNIVIEIHGSNKNKIKRLYKNLGKIGFSLIGSASFEDDLIISKFTKRR